MAKICTQCGAELSDDIRFCTECGAPLPEGTAPQTENKPEEEKETVTVAAPAQPEPAPAPEPAPTPAPPPPPPVQTPPPRQTPPPQQPVYQQPVYAAPAAADDRPAKGSKYEPISTGGFIGIMLLLCIPIVGLILMIVWACGGCRKVTKRAMARAMLIITAIMLVLAIIFGVAVKGVINKAMKEIGIEDGGSGIGSLFGGRDKDKDDDKNDDKNDGLGGLLGALGSLSGDDSGDLGELGELGELFSALEELEGLTGEDMTGDLGGLLGQAEDANKEANSKADGWPRGLREYPGEIVSVSAARSEVHNTTREEMLEYIDDLKADGFKFQDFYDFGFTEEDMLGMDGWWATDGDIYLSLAYYDGTVTIDHTYELPDYGF